MELKTPWGRGVADPDHFSYSDQLYSEPINNSPEIGADLDIYSVNAQGEMRFYNHQVHGPADPGIDRRGVPADGTYVGNRDDWLPWP